MATSIMIIEDSENDRYIARRILSKRFESVDILEAVDGFDAIRILDSVDQLPSLIFLDINMPRMNGHEFLQQWYAACDREVPVVVMLTSSDQASDFEQTQVYSFVKGYFVKPMTAEHISEVEGLIVRE